MKTPSTCSLSALIPVVLLIALFASTVFCEEEPAEEPQRKRDWVPIKYEGGNYVSASNIAKFYQFTTFKLDRKTQSSKFVHSSAMFKLNAAGNHKEIQINGVRISLISKTVWDEENERLLLATVDLANVIEPAVRPSYIKNTEDDRPYFFTLEGEETLIKKFDHFKLLQEVESRGLTTVNKRDGIAVIHTKLIFNREEDETKPDLVSTQWFWKKKIKGVWDTNTLSIALAISLHAHLSHKCDLEDNVLSPRQLAEGDTPPRAEVVFTLNDSFDSFEKIHSGIANAIIKNRQAVGRRR